MTAGPHSRTLEREQIARDDLLIWPLLVSRQGNFNAIRIDQAWSIWSFKNDLARGLNC